MFSDPVYCGHKVDKIIFMVKINTVKIYKNTFLFYCIAFYIRFCSGCKGNTKCLLLINLLQYLSSSSLRLFT